MGLRDKAQLYRESLKQDRIENLEDYYEGQVLTRPELLEIKEMFSNKILLIRQELEHNVLLIQNILDFGKSLQNTENLAEFYDSVMEGLSKAFSVRQALFLEWNDKNYRIVREIGIGEKALGVNVELTLQEEESLNNGRANIFENNFSFREMAPGIDEYLLIPISRSGNRLGVLVILSIDSGFPMKESESIQVFEWIAGVIVCPYIRIQEKEKDSDPYMVLMRLIRKEIDAALFAGDILSLGMVRLRNQKKFCELHGVKSYTENIRVFQDQIKSKLSDGSKVIRCGIDQILLIFPGLSKPECDSSLRDILLAGTKAFQNEQEMDIGLDAVTAVYPLDAEDPEEYLSLLNA